MFLTNIVVKDFGNKKGVAKLIATPFLLENSFNPC